MTLPHFKAREMTDTCRDIIKAAYRIAGVSRAGASLNSTQAEVGLERLKDMYRSWFGSGMFGSLNTIIKEENYTAKEWDHVSLADDTYTVTLPVTVFDDYLGTDRVPLDGAPIVVTNRDTGISTYNLYNPFSTGWQDVEALTLNNMAPLSSTNGRWLKEILATMLADEYGLQLRPYQIKQAGIGRVNIGSYYGALRTPASGVQFF